ncbi:MAG: Tat pathway signal sequence domain protein [Opitutales bacterium]|nr:Tat pathway signal sequence domain protein [Opitutales bacterium]
MKSLSRREFVRTTAIAAASLKLASQAMPQSSPTPPMRSHSSVQGGPPRLRWLESGVPASQPGTAWGLPWPKGKYAADTQFSVRAANGAAVPAQTWPMAYWPDGSLKWSGHAISAGSGKVEELVIEPGTPLKPEQTVRVQTARAAIDVDTGVMSCRIAREGTTAIRFVRRDGVEVARNGRIMGMRQDKAEPEPGEAIQPEGFVGEIESAEVEQNGPVRAVIKVTGRHRTDSGRHWLPFTLRFYFHAGGDSLRIAHTFVYDGDDAVDFISGLGLRFEVPLREASHNRHLRFVGEDKGVFSEAVRGITGLWRDPGESVRQAQAAGKATPPLAEWLPRVANRLHWIPQWGDYTLSQLSANAFTIRKRTQAGHAWVPAAQGKRSAGLGYVGDTSGGVAFGMRDFWQAHPSQLDIRNAHTEAATVTLWLWSPEAPAMDLRFYHDGLGQETHAQQLDAMDVTYEDYEPGFGTPVGIARTSEVSLFALAATPTNETLANLAAAVQAPPLLTARPEDYLKSGVFGGLWSLPDRSTPEKARIEDRLDWSIDFYTRQVDQHHWYGFWDFGDVMHTYDSDRSCWRYDVGGYAWANSELSPDLWLWYSFLRTGDRKAFHLADAMTRHTRDVDIYHLGRFVGLGTRHNVQHWGCSAKQLRISTAAYRRFHYFLTTDERTGDVLDEVIHADRQLAQLNPTRKLQGQTPVPAAARMGVGTDWGSAVSNWLTAWERTGDGKYKRWIENSMRVIGNDDYGFFQGVFGFDPDTKELLPATDRPSGDRIQVSHLNAVFGLVEVCAELIDLIEMPAFKEAWLKYCSLYLASEEAQIEALGRPLRGTNLHVAHSRLAAFAAVKTGRKDLAELAWNNFRSNEYRNQPAALESVRVEPPKVINPIDEATWVSTNDSAQWGLAAIQNLALVSDAL